MTSPFAEELAAEISRVFRMSLEEAKGIVNFVRAHIRTHMAALSAAGVPSGMVAQIAFGAVVHLTLSALEDRLGVRERPLAA
jgi:putative exporter of polyketide antibiotics